MFLREQTWMEIWDEFSPDEKAALRSAVTGQIICPAGVEINTDALDAGLAEKLTSLVLGTRHHREARS